jgi:cell division topological specificity factor
MNFSFFRRTGRPASVARERLQVLLAHERSSRGSPDLIAVLRDEILAAIAKYVRADPDSVEVKMDRRDSVTLLEIDVEIVTPSGVALRAR